MYYSSIAIGTGLRLRTRYKQKHAESIGIRWLLLSWRKFHSSEISQPRKSRCCKPSRLAQIWLCRDTLSGPSDVRNILVESKDPYRILAVTSDLVCAFTFAGGHGAFTFAGFSARFGRFWNRKIRGLKFSDHRTFFKIKVINAFLLIPHTFVCIDHSTSDPCR